MRLKSTPIPPWRPHSVHTTYWSINDRIFILEHHTVPNSSYYLLYSPECPNIRVDTARMIIPIGATDEEVVNLLTDKIKFIYDMYIKLNINGWEQVDNY